MSNNQARPNNREQPMRIFKSDFLEFFTRISPVAVVIVWLPIVGFFLWQSINDSVHGRLASWFIPVGIILGIMVWSFIEYVLHRFVFHYHPKTEWGKRLNFMFHGVHHAQPMVKSRLVMPPLISIPIGAIMYGLYFLVFGLILGTGLIINPLFTGTAFGYLLYDMTHYATHHFNIKSGWFSWIRSHHMKHHVQTPEQRFGVTSPLWDYIFGTEPKQPKTSSKNNGQ